MDMKLSSTERAIRIAPAFLENPFFIWVYSFRIPVRLTCDRGVFPVTLICTYGKKLWISSHSSIGSLCRLDFYRLQRISLGIGGLHRRHFDRTIDAAQAKEDENKVGEICQHFRQRRVAVIAKECLEHRA